MHARVSMERPLILQVPKRPIPLHTDASTLMNITASPASSSSSATGQPSKHNLDVSALDFDPENPRFPPEISAGNSAELIERFIRDERLLEIITSIADQGYFEGEPLLAVPHGKDRYHVIEGNRRLAALKLLSGEIKAPEGRISVEEAVANAVHRPPTVPCLVFDGSDQILRYLGFRHITGIKSWSSLQKARYIKRMRDTFYMAFDGKDQLLKLAREIGSRSDYVGQMLTALKIYERAESQGFYKVEGLNPQEIDFSVLSTALSYTSIAEYLGLEGRQDTEATGVVDEHVKNLLSWMFVARGNQKSILGESRNLKRLAAVVKSEDAISILIKEGNLTLAYELSGGPAKALNMALKSVERRLKDVWEWLPIIDEPEEGDEDRADNVRKLSLQLRDAIKAKRSATDDE